MGPDIFSIAKIFNKDVPPFVVKLIRDKSATADLLFLLAEAQRLADVTKGQANASAGLRGAFNDVAGVLPLAKTVLEKNGGIAITASGKYHDFFRNAKKYEAAGKAILASFETGEPAAAELLAKLAADDRVAAALRRILPKMLPPEGAALVQDPAVVKDLVVLLQEVENAAKNTGDGMKPELKSALADLSTIIPLFRHYLETDRFQPDAVLDIALNMGRYKESGKVVEAAQKAEDPELDAFTAALRSNEKIVGIFKKIVPRARTLFTLEDANGKTSIIEKVSGNSIKFPLEREDYNDIQELLAGRTPKPRAPKGPAGPSA